MEPLYFVFFCCSCNVEHGITRHLKNCKLLKPTTLINFGVFVWTEVVESGPNKKDEDYRELQNQRAHWCFHSWLQIQGFRSFLNFLYLINNASKSLTLTLIIYIDPKAIALLAAKQVTRIDSIANMIGIV